MHVLADGKDMTLYFNAAEELHETKCYQLGPVIYVPHYQFPGLWAQPGYTDGMRRRSGNYLAERDLLMAGAVPVTKMLWSRPKL